MQVWVGARLTNIHLRNGCNIAVMSKMVTSGVRWKVILIFSCLDRWLENLFRKYIVTLSSRGFLLSKYEKKIYGILSSWRKCRFLARATVGTLLYVWLRQCVRYLVRFFFATSNLCLNDQAYNCLTHFGGSSFFFSDGSANKFSFMF